MNQTRATRTPSAYYVSNYSYNYTAVQTKENGKQKTFNILDYSEPTAKTILRLW